MSLPKTPTIIITYNLITIFYHILTLKVHFILKFTTFSLRKFERLTSVTGVEIVRNMITSQANEKFKNWMVTAWL